MKFISPDGTKIQESSCEWKYIKRLRGHSSFVTHIDWSEDNTLLKSTCGAYELLYWDVCSGNSNSTGSGGKGNNKGSGKQILSTTDTTEADTIWATNTCILGFDVMGIWKPNSSGDDINNISVDRNRQIVYIGDDYGGLNVYNYPCVVLNPPGYTGRGHSSHVMGVTCLSSGSGSRSGSGGGGSDVVSVGGNDNSVFSWSTTATRTGNGSSNGSGTARR